MAIPKYTLLADGNFRRDDGAWIPNDPANADYQLAKTWVHQNGGKVETESLENVKADKIKAIAAAAAAKLSELVAGRSPAETLMWTPKATEAQELIDLLAQGSPDVKTLPNQFPLLFSEAKTLAAAQQLAREVLEKQRALKMRSGSIIGTRTRKTAETDAIKTLEEAIAYDPSAGWD